MDEPTIAEMIRDVQSDVTRILSQMDRYVTQEQRAADKELAEYRFAAIDRAIGEEKARTDRLKNWAWTALVGPVIVGVILYLLIGKTP